MKKILFILCMLVSLSAFSQTVDVNQLPVELRQEVLKHAQTKERPTQSAVVRQEAGAWADMIGNAVFNAAQKSNMLVDDFSKTWIGKVTVGIVAYKVIGKDVMRVIVGGLIVVFGFIVGFYILRQPKRLIPKKVEYTPFLFGLWNRRVVTEWHQRNEDPDGYYAVGILVFGGSGLLGSLVAFLP